jgi:hypothetical protein
LKNSKRKEISQEGKRKYADESPSGSLHPAIEGEETRKRKKKSERERGREEREREI